MGDGGSRAPVPSRLPLPVEFVFQFGVSLLQSRKAHLKSHATVALCPCQRVIKGKKIQTLCSTKLSDLAPTCGFGDSRWAGATWNENKGRGLGENWGMGDYRKNGRVHTQAPRGPGPRHLTAPSACNLTQAQASLPVTARPTQLRSGREPAWSEPRQSARTWRAPSRHWRVSGRNQRDSRCANPAPLARAGGTHPPPPPAESITRKKNCGFLVSRVEKANGGLRRGAGPCREVPGRQKRLVGD